MIVDSGVFSNVVMVFLWMSISVPSEERGTIPRAWLSFVAKMQTLESYTLLVAPVEAAGARTTSDTMFSSREIHGLWKWRQRSRRKPIQSR